MANYMMSFELRTPEYDYAALYKLLQFTGAAQLQNSVWLVSVNGSAEGMRAALEMFLDEKDTVAVIRLPDDGSPNVWATRAYFEPGIGWLKNHYG